MSELSQLKTAMAAELETLKAGLMLVDKVDAFAFDLLTKGLQVKVDVSAAYISINIGLGFRSDATLTRLTYADAGPEAKIAAALFEEAFPGALSQIGADLPPAQPPKSDVSPWFGDDVHAVDALDAEIDALVDAFDAGDFLTELPEGSDLADTEFDALRDVGHPFADLGRILTENGPAIAAALALPVALEPLPDLPDIAAAEPTSVAPAPDPEPLPSPAPPVVVSELVQPPAPRQVAPKTPYAGAPRRVHLPVPAEKSAEWTPGMVARLCDLVAKGLSYKAIGAELGRSEGSVSVKLVKVRAAQKAALGAAEAMPVPRPDRSPTHNTLAHRLDRLEGSKLWPMALNLQLAVHAKAKKKMTEIATLLGGGLTPEDVSAQLLALCPNRARVGALDELVEALRQRVET